MSHEVNFAQNLQKSYKKLQKNLQKNYITLYTTPHTPYKLFKYCADFSLIIFFSFAVFSSQCLTSREIA